MAPFMHDRSEWHTPVASILTLTSPGPDVGQLDVVADLEGGVPHVSGSAARMDPPVCVASHGGGRSRTGSSLTVRQMRTRRDRCDDRVLQVRRGRSGVRGGRRSGRHGAHRRCPPRPRNRYVHALRALGLEKGDAVAVVLPNGVLPVEVYLAALQAGWYYVPINYRLSPPEIAYIVQDSGAKAIVSHERYASVISTAAEEAGLPTEARLAHGTVPGFSDVEAALAAQPDTRPRTAAPVPPCTTPRAPPAGPRA